MNWPQTIRVNNNHVLSIIHKKDETNMNKFIQLFNKRK